MDAETRGYSSSSYATGKLMEGEITLLLRRWRQGDDSAGAAVVERMYKELHRIAELQMRRERPEHTLQPTALVNELYMRLLHGAAIDWSDRSHFLAVATQTLRRILVDHARKLQTARREGIKVSIEDQFHLGVKGRDEEVCNVDEALTALAVQHERPAKAIEMRYFGGLLESEIGTALGVSVATVKRDLAFARAWMMKFLNSKPGERPGI
jgi:RNA polymerase sigma-70 factor (ECF subfamily)